MQASEDKLRPQLTPTARSWVEVLAWVLLCAWLAWGLSRLQTPPFQRADAGQYLALARGNMGTVLQPFASRPLSPLVARALGTLAGRDVEWGFQVQGALCLLLVLAVVFGFLVRIGVSRGLLLMVAFAPFWSELYGGLALPDLWYAALLAGLLWMLKREWWFVSAAMFLPLMLSRESTWLTLLCLFIAGWRRIPRSSLGASAAASIFGASWVGWLARASPGNSEGLPQIFYLLAKMPWNFARNVLGVQPWAERYGYPTCATPLWSHPSHWGAVGFCAFSPEWPLSTLRDCLLTFGVLPLLAVLAIKRPSTLPVWLRFAIVFGGVSLLLGPVLGTRVYRLIGYGWPLAALAGPWLVQRVPWSVVAVQVALSLGLVWMQLAGIGDGWADLTLLAGWTFVAWSLLGNQPAAWRQSRPQGLEL